jgi:hypothetical protein
MSNITIEELEYEIKQNRSRIATQAKRVQDYTADLQNMVDADDYNRSTARNWTDGHVSEEVTHLASLLQKQSTLEMALAIVKKGVQE